MSSSDTNTLIIDRDNKKIEYTDSTSKESSSVTLNPRFRDYPLFSPPLPSNLTSTDRISFFLFDLLHRILSSSHLFTP